LCVVKELNKYKDEDLLYRPSMAVRVIVFLEFEMTSLNCSISLFLGAKYAGWFGFGSVVHPFSKLNTTEDKWFYRQDFPEHTEGPCGCKVRLLY
jgi:hypothetical protein